MALRSGVASRHQIPHEPGEWMDLRQLGWAELDEARRAKQSDSFKNIREMGDAFTTIQRAQKEIGGDGGPTDPMQQYDLGTVLKLGITAWSYPDDVSPVTIRLLDPQTAEWAARAIVGVGTESEAERKNGSEPSSSP